MLIPLKHNTNTILCVGSKSPTITIDNDTMGCQPIYPRMTSNSDMSITQRSTVSKILEISNSQPWHIISALTLVPRGELTCNGFSKVSTSKPNYFTHDVVMNECDTVKPRKSVLIFFFLLFSSENERIGNSCRDGTNKTLDFSLDLK